MPYWYLPALRLVGTSVSFVGAGPILVGAGSSLLEDSTRVVDADTRLVGVGTKFAATTGIHNDCLCGWQPPAFVLTAQFQSPEPYFMLPSRM